MVRYHPHITNKVRYMRWKFGRHGSVSPSYNELSPSYNEQSSLYQMEVRYYRTMRRIYRPLFAITDEWSVGITRVVKAEIRYKEVHYSEVLL